VTADFDEVVAALGRIRDALMEIGKQGAGDDMDAFAQAWQQLPVGILADLRTLDEFLTGNTSCRDPERDLRLMHDAFEGCDSALLYLSDSGYSRLVLRPPIDPGNKPFWITTESRPEVIARWETLIRTIQAEEADDVA
jgi:hypothetical protein